VDILDEMRVTYVSKMSFKNIVDIVLIYSMHIEERHLSFTVGHE